MRRDAIDLAAEAGRVFTRADARAAGLTDRQISACLRRGELVAVRSGVYVDPRVADPTDVSSRAAAALCRLGPDAAASHRTAAVLAGMALLGQTPTLIDVTRPAALDRTPDRLPGVRALRAALPPTHVIATEVRRTTAARTVFDVARTSSFRAGVVTADSALHLGLTDTAELLEVAAACPRWPGRRRALDVIAFADPLAESAMESVSRVVFRDHELPIPRSQVAIGDAAGFIGRVDFLWDEGVVGEADGRVKYEGATDPLPLWAEKLRQERLEEAGFVVVRWTWFQLFEQPERVAARIRSALERAGRRRTA